MTANVEPIAADIVGQSRLVLDCLPSDRRHRPGRDDPGWNRVAEHLYGRTAAEAIGRPASDVVFLAPIPRRSTGSWRGWRRVRLER